MSPLQRIVASGCMLTLAIAVFLIAGWIANGVQKKDPLLALLNGITSANGIAVAAVAVFSYLTGALAAISLLFTRVTYGLTAYRLVVTAIIWMMTVRLWTAVSSRRAVSAIRLIFEGSAVASAVVIGWVLAPNWLTKDLCAIAFALYALPVLSVLRAKPAIAISLGVMAYDALAVFGHHTMQKVAALAADLPVLITIPAEPSLASRTGLMLGLGDIILPGIIVMLAMREAKARGVPSLATGALVGYAAGLIAAFLVVRFHGMQPATIYLVPGAFAGLFIAARRAGIAADLLRAA